MLFIPDEQEKTVKIPVQVRAGQIQFYFDGPPARLEGRRHRRPSGSLLRCPRS